MFGHTEEIADPPKSIWTPPPPPLLPTFIPFYEPFGIIDVLLTPVFRRAKENYGQITQSCNQRLLLPNYFG